MHFVSRSIDSSHQQPRQDNPTGKDSLAILFKMPSNETFTGRERTTFPRDKTRASQATRPSLGSWRTREISSMLNPSPYPPQLLRTSSSPSSSKRTPTRTTSSRRRSGQRSRSLPRRTTRMSRAMRISQRTVFPPPPSASPLLVQTLFHFVPLV